MNRLATSNCSWRHKYLWFSRYGVWFHVSRTLMSAAFKGKVPGAAHHISRMTTTAHRFTALSKIVDEVELCKDPKLQQWAVSYSLHLHLYAFLLGNSSAPTVSSPVILASRAQTWKGSRNSSRSLCP